MAYAYAFILAVIVSVAIGGRWLYYRYGKNDQKLKTAEKVLDNVEKANIAGSNDAYDDKLREKYNR